MQLIIPLAGPDIFHPELGFKPLFTVDGMPLLRRVVTERRYLGEVRRSILVFRADPRLTQAHIAACTAMVPHAAALVLPHGTRGALLSALAGAALLETPEAPVCVDLCDILYRQADDPLALLRGGAAGALPYFTADHAGYSYLRMDGDDVLETAEKRVISKQASAGTYYFSGVDALLRAAAWALAHPARATFNDSFFVCPAYNGLIAGGQRVVGFPVSDVTSVSSLFQCAA